MASENPLFFSEPFVIFFISHGRRQLLHFEITAHPTAAWVWRQLIEATPWDRPPRYLIRDHDRV
jgi:putative transposase